MGFGLSVRIQFRKYASVFPDLVIDPTYKIADISIAAMKLIGSALV